MKDEGRETPSWRQVQSFQKMLAKAGEKPPADRDEFKAWLKEHAERELWFFSRWILGNEYLSLGTFHRQIVCPYLTDYSNSRFKLLMLPMGCLKTTIASRSIPPHALIQPAAKNIYFPGVKGCNIRTLLVNENTDKSKENLAYISEHLMENKWIYWLWPEICWQRKKDAKRWTDTEIEVPRTRVIAEPSITAAGIKTGWVGRYYDLIVADDISALQASQDPPLMERAKKVRRTLKTRFSHKETGIYLGAMTHWGANDTCVEWRKDLDFEVMVKGIEEPTPAPDGPMMPLWPEKYPAEWIEKTRKGMDPIEFSLWLMNKPVPSGYTALNWEELREYTLEVRGDLNHPYEVLVFSDAPIDEQILMRHERKMNPAGFRLGKPLSEVYPGKPRKPGKGPEIGWEGQGGYLLNKYPSLEHPPPNYPNPVRRDAQ